VSYLLDTTVVSEWAKPRPNEGVVSWLADVDEDRVYLSVVTLAELRHGIARLPVGRRRTRFDQWMREDVVLRFDARLLPIDTATADVCGTLLAQSEDHGRPMGVMDALIAATAQVHGMTLVTRNVSDFEATIDTGIVNPWTPE
jgi:toxin FitB